MKIGLTGSIACGKSAVGPALYSNRKGCQIVDADAISRALTAEGGAALPEIRKAFGDGVFSGQRSTVRNSASLSLPTRKNGKRSTPFYTR